MQLSKYCADLRTARVPNSNPLISRSLKSSQTVLPRNTWRAASTKLSKLVTVDAALQVLRGRTVCDDFNERLISGLEFGGTSRAGHFQLRGCGLVSLRSSTTHYYVALIDAPRRHWGSYPSWLPSMQLSKYCAEGPFAMTLMSD
jgi:hypothetical protein